MVATDRIKAIFDDARAMHAAALDRLAAGDIRDAAEKAWCATLRATNAIVLGYTNEIPEKTPQTSNITTTVQKKRILRTSPWQPAHVLDSLVALPSAKLLPAND